MSVDEFKQSVDYIINTIHRLGYGTTHVNIQYLGGEILLVPFTDLCEMVEYTRVVFPFHGITVRDGVQSNLIGSKRKVEDLSNLFDGRIGTSIDSFSNLRTVKGDTNTYNVFFKARDEDLYDGYSRVPAVYTMDATMYHFAIREYELANVSGRNITFKRVFGGGRDVAHLDAEQFSETMMEILEAWFLKSNIIVEPFNSMLRRYMQHRHNRYNGENFEACHFQSNCATRSLSLEPNGDLYICQDLADKDIGKLGNALENQFDDALWKLIDGRSDNLSSDCLVCPYLSACRGGCMVDSFESGYDYYGKGDVCITWKKIFQFYDKAIELEGENNVYRWQRRINR